MHRELYSAPQSVLGVAASNSLAVPQWHCVGDNGVHGRVRRQGKSVEAEKHLLYPYAYKSPTATVRSITTHDEQISQRAPDVLLHQTLVLIFVHSLRAFNVAICPDTNSRETLGEVGTKEPQDDT